ncbi:hypothetical protein E3P99_03909 [Wallemia hederae]|uniref:Zn(2)-C6 fungal-type domain-containing protein n=1 Tax=Wallemia hederae TaxID=1540922 RepID=A0A4T0FEL9_9BASI|nr:hypothetical protein E3P99_03909 [Wallemia hederae]
MKQKRRTVRACQNCRKAKTKCVPVSEDSDKCRYCVSKNLDCVGIEEDRPTRGADKKPRKAYKAHGAPPSDDDGDGEYGLARTRPARKSSRRESTRPAATASSSHSHSVSHSSSSHHNPTNTKESSRQSSDDDSDEYRPEELVVASNNPSAAAAAGDKRRLDIPMLNEAFKHTASKAKAASQPIDFATLSSLNSSTLPSHPSNPLNPLIKPPPTEYQQHSFWHRLFAEMGVPREMCLKVVISEIWKAFSKSDLISSLFHLPSLYKSLIVSSKRELLEPSLICALLAISFSVQGSSDRPESGTLKSKSLHYAAAAHTYLITAVNASKFTLGIAQAAVCLHYYEFLPKPSFNTQKLGSAIIVADIVINKLAMTSVDAHRVSWVYDDDGVPLRTVDVSHGTGADEASETETKGCPCDKIRESSQTTQKAPNSLVLRVVTSFSANDRSEQEVEKEEVRRTVWAALSQAWKQTLFHPVLPLHTVDSSNYGIFHTSELWISEMRDSSMRSWSRRTLPALLERVKLLCLGAIRLRSQPVDFHIRATKIISEAEVIEDELRRHTCKNAVPVWQIQNIAFMIRLILTAKVQAMTKSVIGSRSYFTRLQASEWLKSHDVLYTQYLRPNLKQLPVIFGALAVQALRCLDIFELDKDVVTALRTSTTMTDAVETILYHHPCGSTEIQAVLQKLRSNNYEEESIRRCYKPESIEPPPPTIDELALCFADGLNIGSSASRSASAGTSIS